MYPLSSLLPSALDLAGLAGVLVAGTVLMLIGRAVTGGRAAPEIALLAGWGAFSFVLTLWGVVTTTSMAYPASAAIVLAAVTLLHQRWRPNAADWASIARIFVLALPIWAIMVAAKPALPDTFTNFLPNAVYVFDHGFFPADDRAHAFATWPAFPYNVQLATYLATFAFPQFPPGALTLFNVLLQVMTGLLFARILLEEPGQAPCRAPSWAACAGGLLLVTLLNPGFVPRIDFTSYAEPALSIGVVVIALLGARLLGRLAAGESIAGDVWTLALVLVAHVNIKQVGVVLGFGLIGGLALLALADRRIPRLAGLVSLAAASLPALGLYGVWRSYVLSHFQSGELKLLPPSAWQFDILPGTLENILKAIAEKPLFFGLMAITIVGAAVLIRREGLTERTRLLLLTLILLAIYNAFLLLVYVIHMGPVAGEAAHSYFRYMTHLALLMTLALTILVRDRWQLRAKGSALTAWRRFAAPIAIALILVAPVAFLKRLRFDLQMPQPLLWDLAREVASVVKDGDRLALLMPGDNGSDSEMLRAALELAPPRRRDLVFYDVSNVPGGLDAAAAQGYTRAIVSCVIEASQPEAALMVRDGAAWRVEQGWPYAPVRGKERWTSVLTSGPLCHDRVAVDASGD